MSRLTQTLGGHSLLSQWRLRAVWASLFLSSVAAPAAPALGLMPAQFSGSLTLRDNTLTARLRETPLHQVMEEISRLSGARIRWLNNGGEERISVEFTALPFTDALMRILGEKNFLLFYTSSKKTAKLTQIWISSTGDARSRLPVSQLFVKSRGEKAPTAGEKDSQPLDTLLERALYDQDSSVRLEAIARLEEHLQKDARVAGVLAEVARSDSNLQLRKAAAVVLQMK